MPTDGQRLLQGYLELDRRMVDAGAPATSPAWVGHLSEFWQSGKRRMVVRKGRQVGASTIVLPRVVTATALFGQHRRSRGTHLTITLVSVSTKDARERLFNLTDVLEVMGERYARRDDGIELVDRGIIAAVYACSARVAVGMTNVAIFEEELPRWWSDETNANPAPEVDAALTPSLVTQANGRVYSFGSPLGLVDFHAELMARGPTPEQYVCEGPSWYFNPTLSEAETHALQPDERRWRREFAAIPQAGALSAFDDPAAVDECFTWPAHDVQPVSETIEVIDANSGGQNEFTGARVTLVQKPWKEADAYVWKTIYFQPPHPWAGRPSGKSIVRDPKTGAIQYSEEAGKPRPTMVLIESMWGVRGRGITHDEIWDGIAQRCRSAGVRLVTGDQRESYANESAAARRGLVMKPIPWNAANKVESMTTLRRLVAEKRLILLPDDDERSRQLLRNQMLSFTERVVPSSGQVTYGPRSGNDDRVAVLLSTANAMASGLLGAGAHGAPPRRIGTTRQEFGPGDFANSWRPASGGRR